MQYKASRLRRAGSRARASSRHQQLGSRVVESSPEALVADLSWMRSQQPEQTIDHEVAMTAIVTRGLQILGSLLLHDL